MHEGEKNVHMKSKNENQKVSKKKKSKQTHKKMGKKSYFAAEMEGGDVTQANTLTWDL